MKFISKLKSKYFLEFVIAFILLCTVGTAVGIAQEVDEAVSLLAAEDPNRELTPEDIPDSILFSALVALADYNGDGKLTVLELNTYSGDEQGSLDLSNLNITDIKGLGYAKGVSSINLSLNNSITVIPDNAFAGCKNLVEIIIPESVVKIGNSAFSGCDKLEIINLPDVLSEIGESSFLNCTSLKEIKLPSKIAKIGSSAFSGCGLLEIEIPYNPENPVRLGANVFNSCTSLSNVILHEGMKSIPVGCFNNTAITGINLPKSVEVIEEKAFCNTNLTNLDLSGYSKLVSIKSGAFSNNYFLNKVVLPEALTELGSNAFENCIILTEIKIPKGITVINDFTFSDCISLHNVIFTPFEVINGENNYKIEEIGNGAFYGCFGLGGEDGKVEFLKNLNNLKKIGDYCFANGAIDTKEKDEEYGETIYYGFRSIVLPDSIQTIGKYAFANCYTLETVNIPYNVTLLDDYTFSKCYNLNEVIFIKDGVQ